MPKTTFVYCYGPSEDIASTRTTRSLSNIDTFAIREAVLMPRQPHQDKTLVIGVFQRTSYVGIPDFEQQLERYTQDFLQAYAGVKDPYSLFLTSMIYHSGRMSAGELQQQLPPDPLSRLIFSDYLTPPRFAKKVLIVDDSFLPRYPLLVNGISEPKDLEDAKEYTSVLCDSRISYGLTRLEALKHLVLEQCVKPVNLRPEALMNARHHLTSLFGYLKMIQKVEDELKERNENAAPLSSVT